jgi:capsule biosynthesis phosphatase
MINEFNKNYMNVIVLIAGKGTRVQSSLPKPMVRVDGKSILKRTTDSLPFFKDLPKEKLWFAVLNEHVVNFSIDQWLRETYGKDINIVNLPHLTRGNLETAKKTYDMIPNAENFPLLILDGDNQYDGKEVAETFTYHSDVPHANVYYFEPVDDSSHWCFAMQRNGRVYDLQEKNPHARFVGGKPMVGVFYFESGQIFDEAAQHVFYDDKKVNNEFFMSQAIKQLFDTDIPVYGFEVNKVVPLGTSQDLEKAVNRKIIICFDIDDTINYCKKTGEEYGYEAVQFGAIEALKKWKQQGHHIVLSTARHMKTCAGNQGMVLAKQGMTLLKWLEINQVPFDELWWSKPHADLFVDDKGFRHEIGNWKRTEEFVDNFIGSKQ